MARMLLFTGPFDTMSDALHRPLPARRPSAVPVLLLVLAVCGCRSPQAWRRDADRAAYAGVAEAQRKAKGSAEPFTIETPADTLRRRLLLDQHLPHADDASLGSADVARIAQWPDAAYGRAASPSGPALPAVASNAPLCPSLLDALQWAARGSREYQQSKEEVFRAALDLDLERDAFRTSWSGTLEALFSSDGSGADGDVRGVEGGAGLGLKRNLAAGGSFALDLGVDLARLLTQDRGQSLGRLADATLTLPLLRGSGRFVVRAPLVQAERNTVYAIHTFERFRQEFAVQVASDYLAVLQQFDQRDNARASYDRLVTATRRARRLSDAGRLPAIQVDQARQDELRARTRWVQADLDCERKLDAFKLRLGLPPDAAFELDRSELDRQVARATNLIARLQTDAAPTGQVAVAAAPTAAPAGLLPPASAAGGPLEIAPGDALRLALTNRLDLRTAIGRVADAQRDVAVAADQLRADLQLLGHASAGESRSLSAAGKPDARLDVAKGSQSLGATLDLPLERTAERNGYRVSLLGFEEAVRGVQELEDRIKLAVRDALRTLQESREAVTIQAAAVAVAERRRDSTAMFLEAGRAEIRDVLEAEAALVEAQDALSAALVRYRVGELELQRDMGVLRIDADGLWQEYVPTAKPE